MNRSSPQAPTNLALATMKSDDNTITVLEKSTETNPAKNPEHDRIHDSTEDEYPLPTEEEGQTLRKVSASLPLVSFSLCLVEFAERASYYGAKTVFSNFVQFPLPKGQSALSNNPRVVDAEPCLI